MAVDDASKYFKKGAAVEVSSQDEGFQGSWFEATVLLPPRTEDNGPAKVLVEYKTLTADEAGKHPLIEELRVAQVRPPPPPEVRRTFKVGEDVDAYYNDGWWEGTITDVVGGDKYRVFYSGTREQIAFAPSELRVHREWVGGEWVPPPGDQPMDYENSAEAEAKNENVIEHTYNPGDSVEVSNDEEGFEGAWFPATILKELDNGKYLIEYKTLKDEHNSTLLTEEVGSPFLRPCPPDIEVIDRFVIDDEVDASCNEGWWVGVISKVLKNDRYSVYFSACEKELKFEHDDLRVHQDWLNGKWETVKNNEVEPNTEKGGEAQVNKGGKPGKELDLNVEEEMVLSDMDSSADESHDD